MILSLLDGISLTPTYGSGTREILSIINQEAGAFFAGQKSLEETAAVIQRRVQLYVSENS